MWIYEHINWSDFTWDADAIASQLVEVRHQQGYLLGRMEMLGFDLRSEAGLINLTSDIVNTSAIEGESLDTNEVRSSIARRLGIDVAGLVPSSRDVEGVVEMMLDATQNFTVPLTRERLFDWHAALFPTGRSGMQKIVTGNWRTDDSGPMQVVSGAMGRETVHFEAPAAEQINAEIQTFLNWFEADSGIDPVIKAGIAHFWFITIHPFEDGNGRIARAIGDMALARADKIPDRFYSISTQIELERKDYYLQLEHQQRSSSDITGWLSWYLACLGRALSSAEKSLANVLFKARLWDFINQQAPINERQRLIINRMLEDGFIGHMNTSKYAKMAKCSNDTALRDIQDLKERGVFTRNPGGGRSTSYRISEESCLK